MTGTSVEVAAVGVLAVLALVAMCIGWSHRAGRWSDLAADLASVVPAGGPTVFGPADTTYLATTPVDAPLERVPLFLRDGTLLPIHEPCGPGTDVS